MNKLAITKANKRLEKMRSAFSIIKTDASPDSIEDAWGEFILAAGTIYSALEEGAKTHPISKAWFGGKKHERRTDPLLRYVHAARNADEHGLKWITERASSRIGLNAKGAYVTLKPWAGGFAIVEHGGDVTLPEDTPFLTQVHDSRFGDCFDPPREHLGQPIHGWLPLVVAEHALRYLEALVQEAASLPD